MIPVVDLKAEFARLTMLEGRTPTSTEAERKGAFGRVAPYRDGAIFTAKFAGTTPGSGIRKVMRSCRSSTVRRRCI